MLKQNSSNYVKNVTIEQKQCQYIGDNYVKNVTIQLNWFQYVGDDTGN